MDTHPEERSLFDHVTCNMSASVDEVTVPGALALDLIEQVLKTFFKFTDSSSNMILTVLFFR